MGRLTKHQQGQTKETFYGINMNTFEVESVSLTRDGTLQRYNRDMQVFEHQVLHGRETPSSECG